jgi:uncharacterized protein (TIGR02145 family)
MYSNYLNYVILIALVLNLSCGDDTSSSNEIDQNETGTITDVDGNIYQTIKIGNQWWMAENLKVTHYSNGEMIPNVTDSIDWINLTTGAWSCYNNDTTNFETYGCLYNWYAVSDTRDIAPIGWHVPTDDEWNTLLSYLGEYTWGNKMKVADTTYWAGPNAGATNESGFSALPGGMRHEGGYKWLRYSAYFGSASPSNNHGIFYVELDYNSTGGTSGYYYQNESFGYSIRCVKD